jgi:hypothetical protein
MEANHAAARANICPFCGEQHAALFFTALAADAF